MAEEKSIGRQASTKRLWSHILSHLRKHINLHRSLQISSLSHTAVIGKRSRNNNDSNVNNNKARNNNRNNNIHDSNAVNDLSTDKAKSAVKPKVRWLHSNIFAVLY